MKPTMTMEFVPVEKIDWSFLNHGWTPAPNSARLRDSIERVEEVVPGTGGLLQPVGFAKLGGKRDRPYIPIFGRNRMDIQRRRKKEVVWSSVFKGLTEEQIGALQYSENEYRRMISGAEVKANLDRFLRASLEK